MNRLQKIALYNIIVMVTALTLTVVAAAIAAYLKGLSAACPALAMLGLLGFMGLSPILFGGKPNKIDFDERDTSIQIKSTTIAYSVFWFLWVVGSIITWAIKRNSGNSISVEVLPLMVLAGFLVVNFVQSIAILISYGWGDKNGK